MKLWKSNRGNGQQQQQEDENRKHQVTNENEASDLDFYERIDVATTSRVESSTKPNAVVDKGLGSRRLDNVWLLPDIPFPSEEISGLHGVETAERVRSFPLPPTPKVREVNAPGHHIRDFVYA
ncbi:unnamed protein product [Dibothriocephalus latus]|uniref:Uncharacterized protein n=1 Tax=Dibothriocephalus latus TaxID=60516 RepID=A0A3P7NLH7_DIBLA|nr:unnamed protein product [Dibothriocephalus latus]